jgi:ABC-type dipeptide/oligopeptide/nickel transport system permease subunit
MLHGGRPNTPRAPLDGGLPRLAISLAAFAFSLFGDSLRDALDPRLRAS